MRGKIKLNNWIKKIDKLDLSVFKAIPSQTDNKDKKSLLAIQRATAKKYKKYTYLEIGSHLGGSIQPHLIDNRCKKIYSIDARPTHQPDDRLPGYIAYYNNNSSERMLSMLRNISYGDMTKIECFDTDASKIDLKKITSSPQIIFIDGEHTKSAVYSDFQFCNKVIAKNGTIVFHDFGIIYPAIAKIRNLLKRQHHNHITLKFAGSVFAIFFDLDLVHSDSYLSSQNKKYWVLNRHNSR